MAVVVNANGQLGTVSFLGAFQGRDQADGQGERSDLALKPVTFRYKRRLIPRASRSLAWWPRKWKR